MSRPEHESLDRAYTEDCPSSRGQRAKRLLALRVTLMGAFSVVCGERAVADADWRRPAARRLFQYFILHQAQPLPRDRILEDLWPESSPEVARASFKTVYSWMRRAIEPDLPARFPSRYVLADDETYTFNPTQSLELVWCDLFDFEKTVREVLAVAVEQDDHDVRPLPAPFIAALEHWQPLAPELRDEAWAAAWREQARATFVQGCLHAAGALLDSGRASEAARWAERVLTVAPWSEEAWQELMRARARQGDRAAAMAAYARAVDALDRELGAPPSALLGWLAQMLSLGEEI